MTPSPPRLRRTGMASPKRLSKSSQAPSAAEAAPEATAETEHSIGQIASFLHQLPQKTPALVPLRQAIAILHQPIMAALQRGYTREDIAALLTQTDIPISATSLRYYLTRLSQTQHSPASSRKPAAKSAGSKAAKVHVKAAVEHQNNPASHAGVSTSRPPSLANLQLNRHTRRRAVEDVISFLLDESDAAASSAGSAGEAQKSSKNSAKVPPK